MALLAAPTKWTRAYVSQIIDRANKRIQNVGDRTQSLPAGRTAPDLEQVAIGSGKHYTLSILFLDICGFSAWPSSDHAEQLTVLRVMNVFMAEMMNIARDFDGTFEKNTGDGLMAYFGTEAGDDKSAVKSCVEAAVAMHYVNDQLISPWLQHNGFRPIVFRTGIDHGEVTIGKVGVPGGLNSFVAIGSTANIACKIMRLIPNGGICIGNEVATRLPTLWSHWCAPISQRTGFVYKATGQMYPAWQLNYRLPHPIS
jgi:class 3 adenylate cyclase